MSIEDFESKVGSMVEAQKKRQEEAKQKQLDGKTATERFFADWRELR